LVRLAVNYADELNLGHPEPEHCGRVFLRLMGVPSSRARSWRDRPDRDDQVAGGHAAERNRLIQTYADAGVEHLYRATRMS